VMLLRKNGRQFWHVSENGCPVVHCFHCLEKGMMLGEIRLGFLFQKDGWSNFLFQGWKIQVGTLRACTIGHENSISQNIISLKLTIARS
jgi:hypothetical protein